MKIHLAVDIGASSGRHVVGYVRDGRIITQEMYRFENSLVSRGRHLCWDMDALFGHVLQGMAACKEHGFTPGTMAVDTWGVDFALVDKNGALVGDTVAYRDARTQGVDADVEKVIPFEELYARTGIQKQAFNTIYQLAALQRQDAEALERAHSLLMIPDYLNFLLTGVRRQEYTNATTTALVNAESKTWDAEIIGRLGLPARLFGVLGLPGETVGGLNTAARQAAGFDCAVLHAASHDTASAYMAVPAILPGAAILSSGTWSLLGVETQAPIITPAARAANFTNEGGYGLRYRFLKNIMGLWMIQAVRRDYGEQHSFAELALLAEENGGFPSRVDVNDNAFLAPENMVKAIQQRCIETGQKPPQSVGEAAACVHQSLADSYAESIREMKKITGQSFTALHIVGGGSKNSYLNSLAAKKTGMPVYAGPTEGTALGNLMAQMIAAGSFKDLSAARHAVGDSFPIQAFT